MSPTQPYLIKAMRDWAIDNGLTPQLLVDVNYRGVQVPSGYAEDGKIVLNIHSQAVGAIEIGKESIVFSARFSGSTHEVMVPVQAVLAIFTREENEHRIVFQSKQSSEQSDDSTEDSQAAVAKTSARSGRRPNLHLVE